MKEMKIIYLERMSNNILTKWSLWINSTLDSWKSWMRELSSWWINLKKNPQENNIANLYMKRRQCLLLQKLHAKLHAKWHTNAHWLRLHNQTIVYSPPWCSDAPECPQWVLGTMQAIKDNQHHAQCHAVDNNTATTRQLHPLHTGPGPGRNKHTFSRVCIHLWGPSKGFQCVLDCGSCAHHTATTKLCYHMCAP